MFRKPLLACAVALPLGLLGAAPASFADTDVDVRLGVPFYTYQVSPRYRYYEDYGWYDAEPYPNFRGTYAYDDDDAYDDDEDNSYVVVHPARISCGEAAAIVRANGFHRVRARDCDSSTYVFRARRDGDSYVIYVNSRNGRMWGA